MGNLGNWDCRSCGYTSAQEEETEIDTNQNPPVKSPIGMGEHQITSSR